MLKSLIFIVKRCSRYFALLEKLDSSLKISADLSRSLFFQSLLPNKFEHKFYFRFIWNESFPLLLFIKFEKLFVFFSNQTKGIWFTSTEGKENMCQLFEIRNNPYSNRINSLFTVPTSKSDYDLHKCPRNRYQRIFAQQFNELKLKLKTCHLASSKKQQIINPIREKRA